MFKSVVHNLWQLLEESNNPGHQKTQDIYIIIHNSNNSYEIATKIAMVGGN